ncbi:hypothetical protein ATE47_09855 [Chryseobacterium sp. IHB B 17019]|uniref:KAP family P-loop NTPase fold protein n=1 Tax=Chryseobacterium sp. IHB B 17019 TaxID=1721091 RepID=UPI00071F758F|nr:P-loop NTPase fold protein [Chryseobacterium sp. IHB B 17019]ALR30811.1 hypothetical protein ATE47_09855 [Chryseobacterium sp. IHB B 17019]
MKVEKFIKSVFFFFLGVVLLIVFIPLIESTFNEFIEKTNLGLIGSSFYLDIFLILVLWLYFSININECKTETPNKKVTFFLLLILAIYIYERWFNHNYDFTTFKFYNKLAYFDMIFIVLTFIDLGRYIKFLAVKESKIKLENILEEDSPIEDKNDDELEGLFSKTVNKIKNTIERNSFKTSYTIGINSEWGDGKSTILNILKNSLKNDEDKILIDFNPWMGFDKKVLIKDFFNSISEVLTENSISNDINEYSKELINEIDNPIIKFIKSIIYKEKSLETHFNDINSKIKLLNKKIVIFVDDVDRLDNEEIFQLLKLIRNTANFSNTFFVIAYDRDYVINSISSINDYSAINYLDKIINTEITLPYFDRSILKEIFRRKLIDKIGVKYAEKIDYTLNVEMDNPNLFSNAENISNDFTDWISNIRQIKKLTNSICINFNGLFDEINFTDLIYIELLKLKYPTIYRLIYTQKNKIFKEVKGELYILRINEKSTLDVIVEKDIQKINKFERDDTIDKTVFGELLIEYCEQSKISDLERSKIYNLFLNLFSIYNDSGIMFTNIGGKKDEQLSISYSSKFERYFAQSIFRGNISEKEFNEFLNSNDEERNNVIYKWINERKEKDLVFRLLTIKEYENKHQYESVLKTILKIENMDSKTKKDMKIGFDVNNFRSKIQFFSGDESIESLYVSEEKFKQFIKSLFTKANYPFIFESDVLSMIRKSRFSEAKFALTNEEMNEILKGYFLNYLDSKEEFDNHFWRMYNSCKKINNVDSKNIFVVDEEVKKKIIEKLKIDKNCYFLMKSLIDKIMSADIASIRIETINDIFDNTDNFENLILSTIDENTDDFRSEFKKFYTLVKNNNWEEISFEFKNFKFEEIYYTKQ